MKVMVTGAAGFIGSAVTLGLLARGNQVIGLDNHNDYYDLNLKTVWLTRHKNNSLYTHSRIKLSDTAPLHRPLPHTNQAG